MTLGERLRKIRQGLGWTQAELAEKIDIQQKQISAYERGANLPSTEILIRLAGALDVSLDYLAAEAEGVPARIKIQDRELLRRLEAIDRLPEKEKELTKEFIDLVLLRNRFHDLADAGPVS